MAAYFDVICIIRFVPMTFLNDMDHGGAWAHAMNIQHVSHAV